jgi:hypothetical protein
MAVKVTLAPGSSSSGKFSPVMLKPEWKHGDSGRSAGETLGNKNTNEFT